jgi:hypothetical protein
MANEATRQVGVNSSTIFRMGCVLPASSRLVRNTHWGVQELIAMDAAMFAKMFQKPPDAAYGALFESSLNKLKQVCQSISICDNCSFVCRSVSPWTFHETVVCVHFVHCAVVMIHDGCDT